MQNNTNITFVTLSTDPDRSYSVGMRAPERLADLVARLLEGSALKSSDSRPKQTYRSSFGKVAFEVFKAFDRIGPPLTDHAEPIEFRRGQLTLKVRSSVWLTELGMMKHEIINRLNSTLAKPAVKEIRLILGNPKRNRPRKPPAPKQQLTPSQREKLNAWTSTLSNERVREAFERAASRSMETGPVNYTPYSGPAGPRVLAPIPVEEESEADPLTYGYGDRSFDRWKLKTPAKKK